MEAGIILAVSSSIVLGYKGNVLRFGKSQEGVTFSCSLLTMEIWCTPFDKVCS